MFSTIKGVKAVRTKGLVLSAFVVLVAALVVLSMTQSAAAAGMRTFKGEVIALDTYDKTLTVKPLELIEAVPMGSEATLTFSWDKNTNVILCDQNGSFEEIRLGGRVSVMFHESEGRLVADAIDIVPVYLACYEQ